MLVGCARDVLVRFSSGAFCKGRVQPVLKLVHSEATSCFAFAFQRPVAESVIVDCPGSPLLYCSTLCRGLAFRLQSGNTLCTFLDQHAHTTPDWDSLSTRPTALEVLLQSLT
eukprot:scpid5821/ scgid16742/ 